MNLFKSVPLIFTITQLNTTYTHLPILRMCKNGDIMLHDEE